MKKLLPFLFISLLAHFGCNKGTEDIPESISFTNPLLSYGPDPWVIQKDSFYYYTNTSSDKIQLWKTKSISRLGNAEVKTIWTAPVLGLNSKCIWAPELHYIDRKWYLYYTAGPTADHQNQRLFVLENTARDPMEGSWVDKGKIADESNDFYALDATFFEINNKRYLSWSSVETKNGEKRNIYIAEMESPTAFKSKRVMISSPQYDWEKVDCSPTGGINEGPEILKNPEGNIFMTFSASTCWTEGYTLGLLSLKPGGDPLLASDWTKKPTPVLKTKTSNYAFGPGHNSFFKSPDGKEDWIIYHARNVPGKNTGEGRSPRIQKFSWNEDGTPNFGEPLKLGKRYLRPSGEKE